MNGTAKGTYCGVVKQVKCDALIQFGNVISKIKGDVVKQVYEGRTYYEGIREPVIEVD